MAQRLEVTANKMEVHRPLLQGPQHRRLCRADGTADGRGGREGVHG